MTRWIPACVFVLMAQYALAAPLSTLPVTIGKHRYTVEIAADPNARERGLSRRDAIGSDGMLFAFPDIAPRKFWMKDTRIPLDILYFSADGRLRFIGHGEPLSLTPIGPDEPLGNVIELDGGRAAADGVRVGDKVTYEIPAAISVR